MVSLKCVHKGCGKVFTDPDEPCIYHSEGPEFHEGQKGWRCCKPRVLTFDEFLSIPPCTTGKHSTIDDTPAPEPKPSASDLPEGLSRVDLSTREPDKKPEPPRQARPPQPQPTSAAPPPAAAPESDSDEPSLPIPAGKTCRRRGCGAQYDPAAGRESEKCVYHKGHALFHEGSKGWTCCKRRVLEFDDFMRIAGCETKPRHLFVGSGKGANGVENGEEMLETVKNDFYQTTTTVIVSVYLKKIDRSRATIRFASPRAVELDLPTTDKKRLRARWPLYAAIDPAASSFKIMATKLELTLVKADGAGWPVLRSDERTTGEIIQVGQAGRA